MLPDYMGGFAPKSREGIANPMPSPVRKFTEERLDRIVPRNAA